MDNKYMQRAIELARLGAGYTAPNPMVGAIIVKDGRIIGEGWHKKCGELHAERNAIASLTEDAHGADIYVTLEPCCHYGRTPPCTEAIVESGISRVFIGSRDPNPLVSGKGAEYLRAHGVKVYEDIMREDCDKLNTIFFHYITNGTPYTAIKYAMTADGRTAAYTGLSKWITGETAREHVHSLRGIYSAVLAGIGTVMADDPMLNCRAEGAHQPLRVIADSKLRISPDSRLCRSAKDYPLLIACTVSEPEKAAALMALGAEVCILPCDNHGHLSLSALMKELADRQISSVFCEGGAEINEALLREGLVQHIYAYIAPKLLGGKAAHSPIGGTGADRPDNAALLTALQITRLGEDVLLEYDVKRGFDSVHGNN